MKDSKAVDHKISLIRRIEREGETKWIANALLKVNAKLKAMGITEAMVHAAIERKAALSK